MKADRNSPRIVVDHIENILNGVFNFPAGSLVRQVDVGVIEHINVDVGDFHVVENIVDDGIVTQFGRSGEGVLQSRAGNADRSGGVSDHFPALDVDLPFVREGIGFGFFAEEHAGGFPAEFIGEVLAGRSGGIFGHYAVAMSSGSLLVKEAT